MDEQVMRTWLMEVYACRPDRFFRPFLGLLIFNSMRAHKTDSMTALVKKMNSELAVILGGLTKEVQPLDISVICSFKAKLRLLWENWMVEGEHSYTNTGRLRQASYATVCQWILDAGINDSIESAKADDSEDEDMGDTGSGLLDATIAQLMISDTEGEDFEGFNEDE
ncbi:Pogo transposable element with KRAB [Turdus rufiventris]|nr:Pogo transposable element with KRAB [Turdus rufiventris]